MVELQDTHIPVWLRIQPMLLKKRLPNAFLFVGPRHAGIISFAHRLIAALLCEKEGGDSCEACRSCCLFSSHMHPDVHYIRQDTPCGGIKIEQIRELQQQIYYTPQLGKHRLIVMESADKMNLSSANALLKILEEPPEHTLFILIAEQMSSLPVTLISRCQKYIFPTRESSGVSGPLEEFIQGQSYPGGSSRAELLKQVPAMMAGLCDFIEGKCSPCLLATQWSSYAFDDVLWLLYLMTAQAIYDQLMGPERRLSDNVTWKSFSQLVDTVHLFHQLDEISAAIRKISHNVNINQTLVVENLLLGYLGIGPEGLFDRTKNDH